MLGAGRDTTVQDAVQGTRPTLISTFFTPRGSAVLK